MFVSHNISNSTARPAELLTAVAMSNFVMAFPLTRLAGIVELRLLRHYAL
jgi:polar amino acid transport system permease protein